MAETGEILHPLVLKRGASHELLRRPGRAHAGVVFSREPSPEGVWRGSLGACALCLTPLRASCDVFMYRGDTPFCSEGCRGEMMETDDAREREVRRRRHRISAANQAVAGERPRARVAGAVIFT